MAFHFHWPPDVIVNLEHKDRLRWVKEISAINQQINGEQSDASDFTMETS